MSVQNSYVKGSDLKFSLFGDQLHVLNPESRFGEYLTFPGIGVANTFSSAQTVNAQFTVHATATTGTNQTLQTWSSESGGSLAVLNSDLSSGNPIWKLRPATNEGLAIMEGGSNTAYGTYFNPNGVQVIGSFSFSSTSPKVVITGSRSPAANSHGFVHEETITAANATGHNSYDWRTTYGGANIDHVVALQGAPTMQHSGTCTNLWTVYHAPDLDAGTVTNVIGMQVQDATGAGTATNQYGIKIDRLTKGGTNYAITVGDATDASQNLLHVNVTGDPLLAWDETNDRFTFNKRLEPLGLWLEGTDVQVANNSSDFTTIAPDTSGNATVSFSGSATKMNVTGTVQMDGLQHDSGGTAGFFGATPVSQQSGTGETTGFTAGSGTGVNDDSTFTGNVGSTAYRISDVVKALKNYGLLAS